MKWCVANIGFRNKRAVYFNTPRIHYYFIVVVLLQFGLACTSEDPERPTVVATREGDCFDGILNGDEVIIDCGGVCPGFCPRTSLGILGGEINGVDTGGEQVDRLQLDPEITYELIGPLLIRDKATLSIPAGTVIKVRPNSGAYIAVAQGGFLLISGRANNPVVITSGAENPAPGDWGGIIICGDAPIVNQVVGRTDIIDIFYGGEDITSTSGAINYLRIEYAGAKTENNDYFDALALYGVGAFTTISNIQTFKSKKNGIRLIGGNVNVENIIANQSGGHSVVVQDDWSGSGNAWYLKGITRAGLDFSSVSSPATSETLRDTISNISIIGPAPEGAIRYASGTYDLTNVFTTNVTLGVNVINEKAGEQIASRALQIDSIEFNSPNSDFVLTNLMNQGGLPFYNQNTANGAGNRGATPTWALGWTVGLE